MLIYIYTTSFQGHRSLPYSLSYNIHMLLITVVYLLKQSVKLEASNLASFK